MKKLSFFSIAVSILLPLHSAAAQWVSLTGGDGAPVIHLQQCDYQGAGIRIDLPGFEASIAKAPNGTPFSRIAIPDHGVNFAPGEPELPVIRFFLEAPWGALPELSWRVLDTRSAALEANGLPGIVHPFQPSVPKIPGAMQRRPFIQDRGIYASSLPIPAVPVQLHEAGILRGRRLFMVEFQPFSYIPATGELTVATTALVRIDFTGADPTLTGAMHARYGGGPFEDLNAALVLNHEAFQGDRTVPALPIGYLVIAGDGLAGALTDFLQWKEEKGFNTTLVTRSQIPPGDAAAIQSYIANAYATWPIPPAYVLLAGDTAQVPAFIGSETSSVDDTPYAAVDGADYLPDIAVGRFPAADIGQLMVMADKTMTYELAEWDQGAWIKQAAFMASTDNYSITENTHNYVIETYLDPRGYTSTKIYSRLGGTAQQVTNAVNGGLGLLIYSGHGSETQWADGPPYYQSHVRGLANGDLLPWVSSHACLTGNFGIAECFGETWLRVSNKGSLAFWGASTYSYWDEDDVLEKGLFESVFSEELYTFGAMTNNGLMHVYTYYGGGGRTQYYFQEYNLLGDPSVDLRTDSPHQLDVAVPTAVPVGSYPMDVTVTRNGQPVAAALVCISKDGEVHEAAYTDASGQATINIEALTPGSLRIVVTARNAQPVVTEAMVLITGCGVVVTDRDTYSCDSDLDIRLWDSDLDINPSAADTCIIHAGSDSEPEPETVVMTETGPTTGQFHGSLPLSTENAPGVLAVSHGDLITVVYQDADCEGAPQTVTAQAETDCIGPAITGVTVLGVTNTCATVVWTTDEPADSVVLFGQSPGDLARVAMDPVRNLTHSLLLSDLDEDTYYYLAVLSTDAHGNITRDDHGGACYRFHTRLLLDVFADTFELPLGWLQQGDGQWQWDRPRGLGGTLLTNPDPSQDHTSGSGMVIGVDLISNGNYNSNTNCSFLSPVIDCSALTGTTLSFYRWLNTNMFTDEASLYISNNGGQNWTEIWHAGGMVNDQSWIYCTYTIASLADGCPNMQIKFSQTSDSMLEASGWNIDDLMVRGYAAGSGEPTPTWAPTLPPTPTATPRPSGTPFTPPATPTPAGTPPAGVAVSIDTSRDLYHPGDRFILSLAYHNHGPTLSADLFVVLDVVGWYWFYPSWCAAPEIDFQTIYLPAGQQAAADLMDFTWPHGCGAADGIRFWAAFLQGDQLAGNMAWTDFSYEE
ncbi:hypothetical protein JW905_10795 [bacterium]|nr:hypothetical protein [candidate division CSSED10-310 bacterium]